MSLQSITRIAPLLACLMFSPPSIVLAADRQPASIATLIHYCRALYLGDHAVGDGWHIPEEQRVARRYFRARTRPGLSSQLVPIRRSLHAGTYSYAAVAYTLAYYGVDVFRNVKRICTILDIPDSIVNPRTKRDRDEIERENAPDIDLGPDDAVEAVRRIYEKYPSDEIWVIALTAWDRSGIASEGPPDDFTTAFFRHPASLLRAAVRVRSVNGGDSLQELSSVLAQYGFDRTAKDPGDHPQYSRVRGLLRRLRHSKDHVVSLAAERLSRAFAKEIQ